MYGNALVLLQMAQFIRRKITFEKQQIAGQTLGTLLLIITLKNAHTPTFRLGLIGYFCV